MRNALRTLRSLRRPGDAPYWRIDCHGDYRLRDFLRVGARSERELLLFLKRTFLPWIPLPLPHVPEFGCSTFAARTPDGRALLGRNFDLNRFSPPLTVRTAPADGYASVSTTSPLFLGYSERRPPGRGLLRSLPLLAAPYVPVDGVNERGLAVAVLLVPCERPVHQETGRVPVTTTTAVRLLLDRAATVGEALALLGRFDMHHAIGSAFHFHLADASGASAVVEWGPDGAARTLRPADGEPQCCTNFRLDRRPAEPSARLGTDRYDRMRDALAAAGGRIASTAAAMDLLAAVAHPPGGPAPADVTAGTRWSAVFDLSEPAVLLCAGCDYARSWLIPVARDLHAAGAEAASHAECAENTEEKAP